MKFSVIESKRFGLRVFRDTFDRIDEKAILETILKNKVDIAILSS